MYTRNEEVGPKRERSGLISHILLQRGDLGRSNPVVDAAAPSSRFGAGLRDHRRRGRMLVKEVEWEVGAGDLVYIPSGAVHSIENVSKKVHSHFSAATPALDAEAGHDTGQPRSEG